MEITPHEIEVLEMLAGGTRIEMGRLGRCLPRVSRWGRVGYTYLAVSNHGGRHSGANSRARKGDIMTSYEDQGTAYDPHAVGHEHDGGVWIEHHGKGYPDLQMDTRVQVRFPDGDESVHDQTVGFWDVNWRHNDPIHPCDITHYRVVKSDE